MYTDPKLQAYIETVCQQVRNRDAHALVKEDIFTHFEDAYQEELSTAANPEQATEQALARIGDPIQLGRTFHKVHRQQIDWVVISLIITFGILGAVVNMDAVANTPNGNAIQGLLRTFEGLGIGLGVGVAFLYIPTHQLQRFAPYILIGTMMLMVVTDIIGAPQNGQKMLFGIDFYQLCPYLFAIGFSDLFQRTRWLRGWRMWMLVGGISFAGLMFAKGHSSSNFALTVLMLFVVALYSKIPRWKLATGVATLFAISVMYLLRHPLIQARFTGAFQAKKHAQTTGFFNYQTQQLVDHAGWFGHGVGNQHFLIYYEHGTLAFAELISSFGWSGGLIFAIAVIWVLARLYKKIQRIKLNSTRVLILALLAVLSVELIYPMLMGLGTFPIFGVNMPLIGGGFTSSILAFGAFGISLGALKRPGIASQNMKQ